MELIRKLLSRITVQMTDNRRGMKKNIMLTGTIIGAVVIGAALGVVSASGEQQTAEEAEALVQESTSLQDEDLLPEEPSETETQEIPVGLSGIIDGVNATKAADGEYYPIGTNVEVVLVGQRTAKREEVSEFDAGSLVEYSINSIDDQSYELVANTVMSDNDYETLLAIVEAEAGSEDIIGRILVANVVFNRVESDEFPDTVTEVVWDQSGGAAQFSPTVDGRIETVTVSDTTREAVNRAIDGEDYSEGALYFLERAYAEEDNIEWFDENLTFLFEYGCHEFYTD